MKAKEYTLETWLNKLPEKHRAKAIRNVRLCPYNKGKVTDTLKTKYPCLKAALIQAFSWGRSPEKYTYWNEVFFHYD